MARQTLEGYSMGAPPGLVLHDDDAAAAVHNKGPADEADAAELARRRARVSERRFTTTVWRCIHGMKPLSPKGSFGADRENALLGHYDKSGVCASAALNYIKPRLISRDLVSLTP